MPIQIGAKPDSGFDDPLGMLKDCHRRIERFLRVLCIAAPEASGRALSPEEAAAVAAALRYFREGGQRHNADEEESLFPRLRQARPEDSRDQIGRLEEEHRRTEALHERVETLYGRWMETAALSSEEQTELVSATAELHRIYGAHIELEESVVFPRAAEVLDTAAIAAMGAEFEARRR